MVTEMGRDEQMALARGVSLPLSFVVAFSVPFIPVHAHIMSL